MPKSRERLLQRGGAEASEGPFELRFAAEMNPQLWIVDNRSDPLATLHPQTQSMQCSDVPDRRADHAACRNPRSTRLSEGSESRLRIPGRRRIHNIVERERRRIGDHREDVVVVDAPLGRREKDELFELGPARKPVTAEQADERVAGVRIDREPCLAQRLIDQASDIALAVRVTSDGGGMRRRFSELAKGRAFAQIACLDHHESILGRIREKTFQGLGKIAAARTDMDEPAATEQANRPCFVGKAPWIACEDVTVYRDLGKRVGIVAAGRPQQRFRTFTHEAEIGAEYENDGPTRVGTRDECVRVLIADRDHGRLGARQEE